MGKSQSAFSLVELLIVIGIIAVLTVMGFAGTNQLVKKSKSTKSLSNLRQIGVAALAYAGDNNGQLPQSSHQGPDKAWAMVLSDYGIKTPMLIAPLDNTGRTLSYAINDFLTEQPYGAENLNFSKLQTLTTPARTLYMGVLNSRQRNSDHFHFAEEGFSPANFSQEVWVELVDRASHYLFVDGHVEAIRWEQVKTLLTQSGSTFIRPDGQH